MLIFGNGIWDPQATKEIKSLLSLGCPDDKILYYRGGMQDWYLLRLYRGRRKDLKYPLLSFS